MSLREIIEHAFAEVPYPGDNNIALHDCPECEDFRQYLRGKSWKDLKFPELRGFQSLSLLTAEALHYFLPGYLLATSDDLPAADMIPYGVISIGGWKDDDQDNETNTRKVYFRLSKEQRVAVVAWLRELSQSGPSELRGDADIEYSIRQILKEQPATVIDRRYN